MKTSERRTVRTVASEQWILKESSRCHRRSTNHAVLRAKIRPLQFTMSAGTSAHASASAPTPDWLARRRTSVNRRARPWPAHRSGTAGRRREAASEIHRRTVRDPMDRVRPSCRPHRRCRRYLKAARGCRSWPIQCNRRTGSDDRRMSAANRDGCSSSLGKRLQHNWHVGRRPLLKSAWPTATALWRKAALSGV